MSRLMSLMTALTMSAGLWAMEPARTILLYPDGAPDSNGYTAEDEFVKEGTKIFKTSVPRLDLYLPADKEAKDATSHSTFPVLLVCPGGAYEFTSTGNEGIDVAKFFVPRGYAIAVLKYRLPNGHENIPLEDAMQAMRLLRRNAAEWHLQAEKIGVMGFSAGGWTATYQMSINNKWDNITRDDLLRVAYEMNVKRAAKIIDQVSEAVSQWRQLAYEQTEIPQATIDAIEQTRVYL